MLSEAGSDDRIEGLPVGLEPVAPDDREVGESLHSPNIANKPLEKPRNPKFLAVRSIHGSCSSHGQATMLLLMKLPVIGAPVVLDHEIK